MQYFDLNDLRFLLFDVFDLEGLMQNPYFQDHDRSSTNLFLDSVKEFSDKVLYPSFKEMDQHAAHFSEGKIIVPPEVNDMMRNGAELGLIGAVFSNDHGGVQLPLLLHTAAYYIAEAANNHLPGYAGLTYGAAELIVEFGTEELKATYVPQMMAGAWAGTMCLTEPQAGSSLSDITTTAFPTKGGHYLLRGQKIFISGGDHEYVENFVHMVLARIDGAPAGTKGISLFLVPKYRFSEEGDLTPNDVTTAGDFQKMGQKGYCTTHLIFGEKEDCRAWLVGEEHQGLKYMFTMMNGARIAVGRGAAAIASASYHHALAYAKERPQGRRIEDSGKKDTAKEQTLIINHPDVRRMLLQQKAISEGALALVLQAAYYADKLQVTTDKQEREKFSLLLELLTPIAKTYPSEKGKIAVDDGVQVLGGYGFCSEYLLEQYYRDIRIFSLYEGTTGIQSLDLLGRKLMMKDSKAAHLLAQEIGATIKEAMGVKDLDPYAKIMAKKLHLTTQILEHLTGFAKQGQYERFLADATVFMDFFSIVVVGWQWLKMTLAAKNTPTNGNGQYRSNFYSNKLHTLQFYFKYEMPKTTGLAETLMDEQSLTIAREKEVLE